MKKRKIDRNLSIYLKYLHQEGNISKAELARRYPEYAQRSIYRHASQQVEEVADRRRENKGRPRKLTDRDERLIIKTMKKLRTKVASFTAKKIQEEAQLTHISTKTIHRVLHKHGYSYLHARKKGLVTSKDKVLRLKFAKKAKNFPKDFWTKRISFYFDVVGFAHKTNPFAEARSTSTMAWRRPSEGLSMTGKGKKEGSGGKVAKFFVGVAYGKGTVFCKQYEWKLNGDNFAKFVERCFPMAFANCNVDIDGAMFLQDGDPSQNSRAAKEAFDDLGCQVFSIPARSPDLNIIENIFHLIRQQLKTDALNLKIEHETYHEFSKRVAQTIKNFSKETINKTIVSMNKRIDMVIKFKGNRIKY